MKRIIALGMALFMLISTLTLPAFASEEPKEWQVYVSITDSQNRLAHAQVKVYDINGNGEISVNEALYYAHVWFYDGGASAGYEAVKKNSVRTVVKLWGKTNAYGFGYCVNDMPVTSMETKLNENDHVHAFAYTDADRSKDTYSYFDQTYFHVKRNESVTLTLKAVVYDENQNPISVPVTDAYVTLNGEKTDFRTDAEGKVTVTFEKDGKNLVGAVSDSMLLIQPSCLVRVEGGFTYLGFVILLFACLVGLACYAAWYYIVGKKKKQAK